jgi:Domain of unknown function (DUF4124)
MKRVMILAVAVALAPPAMAQLYKYVDKNGKTVYSDQPPANVDSKQINVPTSRPTDAPPVPKTAVEREKEAEKARKEGAKKADKAEKDAARQAQIQARCTYLKADLASYDQGGRLAKINEKGEREILDDAAIESAKARTRREMEEACNQK